MSHGFKSADEAYGALKECVDYVSEQKARGDTSAETRETIEKMTADLNDAQSAIKRHDERIKAMGTSGLFGAPDGPGKGALGGVFVPKSVKDRGPEAIQSWVVSQPTKGAAHKDYQELSDAMCIIYQVARGAGKGRAFMERSPIAQEYVAKTAAMFKAIDTAESGGGTEWVPTQMSQSFIDKIRDAGMLFPIFPFNFTMPTKTFDFPRLDADSTVYKVSESADDVSTAIPASQPTTAKTTFTLGKLAGRVLFSTESVEDMTIEIASVIVNNLARKLADGVDENIVNGDTTATHMHTDITASNDRRKLFKGLTKYANASSYETDAGGDALTSADIKAALRSMGQWAGGRGSTGGGVSIIPSWEAYFDIVGDTNIITREKYGDAAGILTGEVARAFGKSVIPTGWIRSDLDTTGLYSGSNDDHTACLLVNLDAFALGTGRQVTVRTSADRHIETDQIVSVATWRGDFQPLTLITSNEACHNIHNII